MKLVIFNGIKKIPIVESFNGSFGSGFSQTIFYNFAIDEPPGCETFQNPIDVHFQKENLF